MIDAQAGWYPDPAGDTSQLRWWDGTQWTNSFTPAQQNSWQSGNVPPAPQVVVRETIYNNPQGYQTRVDQVYIQAPAMDSTKRTLRLVAFILCLLSTIGFGIFLIPLAWMIPMTVHSWGLYQGTKRNTIGFGVCALLFLNFIGGILLLVSGEDNLY